MARFNLERAMEEIELINEQLDDTQTSLEKSIELFKRGSKLLAQCQKQLTEYEQQVKILTGDGRLEDFDTSQSCSE